MVCFWLLLFSWLELAPGLQAQPRITLQPQNQAAVAGEDITFRVEVAGDPPLAYQWRNLGNNIPGATNATLTFTNAQPAQSSYYSVVVTNALGSALSAQVGLSFPVLEPYRFSTIAGQAQVSGDADGFGEAARFNNPVTPALDSAGNLYVADFGNHTIRRLTPTGTNWVVSTLAGASGQAGLVNGTNSAARFNGPNGVAVDRAGNVYVTDRLNKAVRLLVPLGPDWVVSTIATGFSKLGGCAVDSQGQVFVTDTDRHTVHKIALVGTSWVKSVIAGSSGLPGSADGVNSAARFNAPDRVAVDASDNLYVGDYVNSTIRKLTRSGSDWVTSTLAGGSFIWGAVDQTNRSARFYLPEGVAVDGPGNIYVCDGNNCTIRKITPQGVTTTLAGLGGAWGTNDGLGSAVRFALPNGLAVDGHGCLYVADSHNHTLRLGQPVVSLQAGVPATPGQTPAPGFGGTLSLASGLSYRVQVSSNLSDWLELTNFTAPGRTYSFWDPQATNCAQRFYRVVGP